MCFAPLGGNILSDGAKHFIVSIDANPQVFASDLIGHVMKEKLGFRSGNLINKLKFIL